MGTLHSWNKLGEEMEKMLRLKTYPLAIRMLRGKEGIPEGAKRPLKDFGRCMNACQAFSMSRKGGLAMAMLKEDNWCPGPVVGYGLEEPTDYYLSGEQAQSSFKDLDASKTWCRSLPRFEKERYMGVVSAPLTTAGFEPDLVVLWVDSTQLGFLLTIHNWETGRDVSSRLSARGACIFEVVPALETGECQVSVPCLGERKRAMTQDDEMVFSIPGKKLDRFVSGMRYLQEHGYGLPILPSMEQEYKRVPQYEEWSRQLGLKGSQ